MLDIGTGAGAIALAIAQERPDARVTATDVSPEALSLARENAAANGLAVDFALADMFDGVDGAFDLVVSNPPYVLPEEVDALEPEVRDWEPRDALVDRGQTERLAVQAAGRTRWLVVEVHSGQAAATVTKLQRLGYGEIEVRTDLSGRDRIVEGRWSG